MFINRIQLKQNLSIVFLLVFCINSLFAQESDTTLIMSQPSKKGLNFSDIQDLTKDGFNFWQDNFSGHFAGIDFGLNTFLNSDYSNYSSEDDGFMENDLIRSNSLFINLINQSIGLQRNRNTIGLVTGLGLQLQSYRLDNNTTIFQEPFGKVIPKTLVFDDNQKSKLSVSYIVAPLLAEFQVPVRHYANRFYFSAGLYGGIRIGSHTKIKYRVEKQKEKLKTPDNFSIHKFKYGIMARAGYRWINVFATYDLQNFFKEEKGPELTSFTFGITLLQF
ncbi:MAG: outer membrane beta-barrel protein [Prolixibacteraceae bacterium]|nr:outer membrane beta-barrel protein [Prolixibacteraceae bacterium]MBN2775209.1 outer membrane beta-barrel protein [Prolixibacteraceae bacterium]